MEETVFYKPCGRCDWNVPAADAVCQHCAYEFQPENRAPRPGDWVRFYRNGQLVVGVVQYVRPTAGWRIDVDTDAGMVQDTDILELRREAVKRER